MNVLNNVKVSLRTDVLSNWTQQNPVLNFGELAIVNDESGNQLFKIGNGISAFNELDYVNQNEVKTKLVIADELNAKAISQGLKASSVPLGLAAGAFLSANANFSQAFGLNCETSAGHDYSFIWSGDDSRTLFDYYQTHGKGTFNINPIDGLNGIYIGESSLSSILSSYFLSGQISGYCTNARANDISAFLSGKITDVDNKLSGYYQKSETSSAVEMSEALAKKADLSALDSIHLSESVTWAELTAKAEISGFIPGKKYRITDYVTKIHQGGCRSKEHQFDLIVTAVSEDKLDENAKATVHDGDTYFLAHDYGIQAYAPYMTYERVSIEAWDIKYCLYNDTKRFFFADTENGKGVIWWMKDEWDNEAYYDFKNVQFWDSNDGVWRYTFDGTDYAEKGLSESYDFSNDCLMVTDAVRSTLSDVRIGRLNECFGNKIGQYCENVDIYVISLNILPSNVFKCALTESPIEEYSFLKYGMCNKNVLGENCRNNTFGHDCCSNTFGDDCYSNTFGHDCCSNRFDDYCDHNIFGDDCDNNIFGNTCYSNTFGDDCLYNTFGKGCIGNKFSATQNSSYYNVKVENEIRNRTFSDIGIIGSCSSSQYVGVNSNQKVVKKNPFDDYLLSSNISFSYDTSSKYIKLKVFGNDIGTVNCADFIKDGMLSSVQLCGNVLVFKFNTDAGITPISVNLSSFVDNYDGKIQYLSSQISTIGEDYLTSEDKEDILNRCLEPDEVKLYRGPGQKDITLSVGTGNTVRTYTASFNDVYLSSETSSAVQLNSKFENYYCTSTIDGQNNEYSEKIILDDTSAIVPKIRVWNDGNDARNGVYYVEYNTGIGGGGVLFPVSSPRTHLGAVQSFYVRYGTENPNFHGEMMLGESSPEGNLYYILKSAADSPIQITADVLQGQDLTFQDLYDAEEHTFSWTIDFMGQPLTCSITLHHYYDANSYPRDYINKLLEDLSISISSQISEPGDGRLTIQRNGSTLTSFTANQVNDITADIQAVTGITMNGSSKGVSGVVDLGTVLTAHQSLTAYETKSDLTSSYYSKSQINTLSGELDDKISVVDSRVSDVVSSYVKLSSDTTQRLSSNLEMNGFLKVGGISVGGRKLVQVVTSLKPIAQQSPSQVGNAYQPTTTDLTAGYLRGRIYLLTTDVSGNLEYQDMTSGSSIGSISCGDLYLEPSDNGVLDASPLFEDNALLDQRIDDHCPYLLSSFQSGDSLAIGQIKSMTLTADPDPEQSILVKLDFGNSANAASDAMLWIDASDSIVSADASLAVTAADPSITYTIVGDDGYQTATHGKKCLFGFTRITQTTVIANKKEY